MSPPDGHLQPLDWRDLYVPKYVFDDLGWRHMLTFGFQKSLINSGDQIGDYNGEECPRQSWSQTLEGNGPLEGKWKLDDVASPVHSKRWISYYLLFWNGLLLHLQLWISIILLRQDTGLTFGMFVGKELIKTLSYRLCSIRLESSIKRHHHSTYLFPCWYSEVLAP